ncbi:MAG: DUF2283 domain-containing protein [Candidatus Woesearchaeota archaeon]
MKITYDKKSDVAYIYLIPQPKINKGIVKETIGEFPVQIDLSKDNKIIGIEVINASKMLDLKYLRKFDFEEI